MGGEIAYSKEIITTTIDFVHLLLLHGWLQGAYTHIQIQSGWHIACDAQSGLEDCWFLLTQSQIDDLHSTQERAQLASPNMTESTHKVLHKTQSTKQKRVNQTAKIEREHSTYVCVCVCEYSYPYIRMIVQSTTFHPQRWSTSCICNQEWHSNVFTVSASRANKKYYCHKLISPPDIATDYS